MKLPWPAFSCHQTAAAGHSVREMQITDLAHTRLTSSERAESWPDLTWPTSVPTLAGFHHVSALHQRPLAQRRGHLHHGREYKFVVAPRAHDELWPLSQTSDDRDTLTCLSALRGRECRVSMRRSYIGCYTSRTTRRARFIQPSINQQWHATITSTSCCILPFVLLASYQKLIFVKMTDAI